MRINRIVIRDENNYEELADIRNVKDFEIKKDGIRIKSKHLFSNPTINRFEGKVTRTYCLFETIVIYMEAQK